MSKAAPLGRPSLASLELFLAVARHRSFRRAATERGVSPSALSHVVRGLEQALQIRLFHRTSRSTSLTEAGQLLQARLEPALGDLDTALAELDRFRGRPSGLLRLNVPRIANRLILQPMIGRFLATYPEIRLEVESSDGLSDIVAGGFDAGIRRDRRLAPGMIGIPLEPARRFAVVGSPGYFALHRPPGSPAELHGHECIGRRFPTGARYGWEFARGGEAFEIETRGRLVLDDTDLMLRAALDGTGLAFLFEELAADHLAAGRLLRVLEDWCPRAPRFFLYYPGRRQVPPALRAFIDMLTAGGG